MFLSLQHNQYELTMGYTTDFNGHLDITPALTAKQVKYINLLGRTRRMKRDINVLWEMYKGKHGNPFAKEQTPEAVYGREGEYFAMDDGNYGQSGHGTDKSIIDYNTPPGQLEFDGMGSFDEKWAENEKRRTEGMCQPGLWCQWEIEAEGEKLVWDGGEKFYYYIEWLRYYIYHFFKPWGVKLNGEIEWIGEDPADLGKIVVKDNVVQVYKGKITYEKA